MRVKSRRRVARALDAPQKKKKKNAVHRDYEMRAASCQICRDSIVLVISDASRNAPVRPYDIPNLFSYCIRLLVTSFLPLISGLLTISFKILAIEFRGFCVTCNKENNIEQRIHISYKFKYFFNVRTFAHKKFEDYVNNAFTHM